MKCEHAQEFFSDYIEQSLDKPTGVALEAHLTACGGCQRELEGLRQTWGALNAVPAVEPPADLAWRVMVQLQHEKLERLEAETARKRANPFFGWLQSLTPGAAFGYATLVALLFIGLAFPALKSAFPGRITFGAGGNAARLVDLHPDMTLTGAQLDPRSGRYVMRLVLTSVPELADSRVTVTPVVMRDGEWVELDDAAGTGVLARGQSVAIPVPAVVGSERVLGVRARVQGAGRTFHEELFAPTARARVGM
jgi:hypothetical protein